jgi:hypothetical protein
MMKADHDCEATAATRATNRAISDLIAAGEVSAEEIDHAAHEPLETPPARELTPEPKPEPTSQVWADVEQAVAATPAEPHCGVCGTEELPLYAVGHGMHACREHLSRDETPEPDAEPLAAIKTAAILRAQRALEAKGETTRHLVAASIERFGKPPIKLTASQAEELALDIAGPEVDPDAVND